MNPKSKHIILGVKRLPSRAQSKAGSKSSQVEYQKVRPAVLKRDDHTCQSCGCRYLKYQEVHHEDDDHTNNDTNNLSCHCVLCHLSHHIGFASLSSKHQLIYCKEYTQGELNSAVRALWIARKIGTEEQKTRAELILSSFASKASTCESVIGTSSPAKLAEHLSSLNQVKYNERERYLKDIRILFDPSDFRSQLNFWAEIAQKNTPPETWLKLGDVS